MTSSSPLGDGALRGGTGTLTRREAEILAFLPAGKTNREIAEALSIARRTVATHLSSIYAKLGVSNRAEAAIVALRLFPMLGASPT